MPDAGLRLLLCTAPSEVAPDLARALLQAKLIGCANLVPAVRSLYWWDGEIQDDAEVLLLMECTEARADEAVAALAAAHPYDVPKILVIEPNAVNGPYLDWLRAVAPPR
ncbi:Periplasmic divalent cation tolerance protein CutA [Enhygromyxa salina]|uniref:Periplasmic divalent cation tolerance protein CutA n=1 Tax=Enhygromyxa salina TaxID=215803 RepID=A0A0C1Z6W0_9BACT|nr:divalent-cation tolerance protein CutA [Enhygromyxa salina]KIG13369.1 Periplasmic divalent cation tolerance protein CutA [Enhygromyxa salina]